MPARQLSEGVTAGKNLCYAYGKPLYECIPGYVPTPDQIREEAEEIRREQWAYMKSLGHESGNTPSISGIRICRTPRM